MLVHSLPIKNRKRLASDAMHTPATHSSCVPDVTDMVKMAVLMAMLLQLSNIIYQQFVDWTSDAFLIGIPFNLVWGEEKWHAIHSSIIEM